MQLEGMAVGHDRVAGVRAALVARHDIRLRGQIIDDFAFSLVTPLGADDYNARHK